MELALRAKNLPKHKNIKNFEKKMGEPIFSMFRRKRTRGTAEAGGTCLLFEFVILMLDTMRNFENF